MSFERIEQNGLSLLLFPASTLSIYVDSLGGKQAKPHAPADAFVLAHADAVADGPMFDPSCNGVPRNPDYPNYSCGEVLYRHVDTNAGVDIPSTYPDRGVTISVMPDGAVSANYGDAPAPGSRVSVQLYPALVMNGAAQSVANQRFDYLGALAVMPDGRLAFVVGRAMTLPVFAQRLAAAGVVYAGYTDGGGSTAIATQSQFTGSPEHRRVLTWLVSKAQASPVKTAAIGLGAVVAIGGVWWLLARSRR